MPEIVSDGEPFQTPLEAANEVYSKRTNPGFGSFVASTVESGPFSYLARAAERGTQEGSSWFDRALFAGTYGAAIAGQAPGAYDPSFDEGTPPPVETPTVPASDYNERFAPRDINGKPISIGDQPMPEGLAEIVGRQKTQALERDSVLQRYAETHAGPTTFLAGTAASLLDPLNASLLFVPGLGEGAFAAQLGGGFAARAAARVAAGAATGAAFAAPLAGLRLGLDPEEAGDYGLREAAKEILYSAAGVAALHGGIGTAADFLRARSLDAATQNAAMRSTVAQAVEGRPVDPVPVLDTAPVRPDVLREAPPKEVAPPEVSRETARLAEPAIATNPIDLAQREQAALREGWAPGVSRDELAASNDAVYGPAEQMPPPSLAERVTAAAPEEAMLEQRLAQLPPEALHPEDQAALAQTTEGVAQAETLGQALQRAATCLMGLV